MDNLKLQAKAAQPGILPKNTRFESYIGHTVINISDCNLEQTQIRALEKGLTFCPTPGPPDISQIWLDFKEFHRRLELMEFFSRESNDQTDHTLNQSIIDFMNNNATEIDQNLDKEDELNKEIQQMFRPKSGWKPQPPNRTLDLFQRSIKQEILKCKTKVKHFNNLTKDERIGHISP